MALEEQRQAAIMTYVNLMRIKAHETGENKELEYQIKVAKIVLQYKMRPSEKCRRAQRNCKQYSVD